MDKVYMPQQPQTQPPDKKFKGPFRMSAMTLVTAVLLVLIYYLAKQQVGVIALKGLIISGGGVGGYWFDRTMFPDSRPHCGPVDQRWRAEYRRVALVIGAMIAAALAS